jgi:hypothetical protein
MTNQELEAKLKVLVKEERRITNEILVLINLADERKLPLERGYSSLFDWLVRGLCYSESAAYRRIEAARLIRAVPEVLNKMESGSVNLTTVAKARSAIRAKEKVSGKKLTREQQAQVVQVIENKSSTEAETALFSLFPEIAEARKEKTKVINEEITSFTIHLNKEDIENLEWVRDHFSHALPGAGFGRLIGRVLKEFRTSAEKKTRVKRCEYVDPKTNKRCASTYQSQTDHILPRALGGTDDSNNLRCLCRHHNILMAEKKLGNRWANGWRARRGKMSANASVHTANSMS